MRRLLPLLGLALAILAAAGLLAGSAWLARDAARAAGRATLRLEAREAVDQAARRLHDDIADLLARESVRPFYLYQHYYSPPDALAAQFVFQPSPLAAASEPLVDTYFELLPDGRLSLPQDVPDGAVDRAGHRLVARDVLPELIGRVHQAPPHAAPAPTVVAARDEPPPAPEPPVAGRRSPVALRAPSAERRAPSAESPTPNAAQVSQMPRWAVETNIRANDIAERINVANQGDLQSQQMLQNDFNAMRGLPQSQVAPAPAAVTPPAAPAAAPDRPRVARRRDAGPTTSTNPMNAAGFPPPAGNARPATHDFPPGTHDAPPTTHDSASPTPTETGAGEVSVICGALEPLRAADGVPWYVRTVDIEGDVRVQGFRLSPGGLGAALGDAMREAERGHDAFSLVRDGGAGTLASAPIDDVPGVSRVAAILRPGSPTLLAEAAEDRRIVRILAGLSAVIVLAVLLGFLALRRELELARRKSDFLSAVSHELRAPVTTIRMYAEMLRDGWVDDAARRAEYETAIVGEGERLSRLVENVLAYARRERGKPLAFREGDLAETVRQVVELQRPVFERAGLALAVEAPAALPWRFDADAVTQILVNLLDNALKHSRDAAERRVAVRLTGAPDAATLAVEDHGPGIAAAEQRRIFEPFYRVGSELTRQTRGAGLGLALVRRLARAHGGDVAVSSAPGQGTTLTVRLGRPR